MKLTSADPNTEIAGVKGKIHSLQKKVCYHISGLEGGNMGMLSVILGL